jgi:uncharacterized damage-inducible protein DinB
VAVKSYLDELYAHQEWADAEHWRAFEAHAPALADRAIRERLHHIHLVQRGFLWVVGPRTSQFAFTKAEDFPNMADLKKAMQRYHADMGSLLNGMDEPGLGGMVDVPWFNPPLKISLRQALTQAAMHSHYHRGQNATRLRELGGVPPYTDFIIWLRDGQAAPRWS